MSVEVSKLQVAIIARSSREMSQTVRIVWIEATREQVMEAGQAFIRALYGQRRGTTVGEARYRLYKIVTVRQQNYSILNTTKKDCHPKNTLYGNQQTRKPLGYRYSTHTILSVTAVIGYLSILSLDILTLLAWT